MYYHQFFQNSSFFPSSPEPSSSSKLGDATDSVSNDSHNPIPSKSPSNNEEPKEKDSYDSMDSSPPTDSFSSPSAGKIHKPLPPFSPYRLKKKDQAHLRS